MIKLGISLFELAEKKLISEQRKSNIDDYSGLEVIDVAINIRKELDKIDEKIEQTRFRKLS